MITDCIRIPDQYAFRDRKKLFSVKRFTGGRSRMSSAIFGRILGKDFGKYLTRIRVRESAKSSLCCIDTLQERTCREVYKMAILLYYILQRKVCIKIFIAKNSSKSGFDFCVRPCFSEHFRDTKLLPVTRSKYRNLCRSYR